MTFNSTPDGDLAQVEGATVDISSVQSGSATDVIDSNKLGNIMDGTCVATRPGNAPHIVIDLGLIADIYAVQVVTPSPAGEALPILHAVTPSPAGGHAQSCMWAHPVL